MAYSKTNWQDLPSTATPLNATNLNKIENELEVVDKSLKYIGNAPTDWNDAKTFGIYHVNGTYTNAPTSSQIWGVLIVYENKGGTWTPVTSGSGSWIWQEFRDTSGKIYRRNATNTSNSWTSWRLDEPIGTVTNNNGAAIKYPDGTMICYRSVSITATITKAWGSWYETADKVNFGDFAVAFQGTPVVTIQPVGAACWVEALNSTSATNIGNAYLARPVSSSSASYTFYVIAIGRWK